MEAGGGFVGIHDAARAEPYSDWFTGLVGARPAAVEPDERPAGRPSRSATGGTRPPRTCRCSGSGPDKWLNWAKNPSGDVHTVARVRESTLPAGRERQRLGPSGQLVP